jgi:uncharacterized protein (DUF1330 family)
MAAYLVANIEVRDPAAFEDYRKRVPTTIAAHGGRYLCRGGAVEVLEGEFNAKRVVVLEFPSVIAARTWYASPEYQALLPLRARAAKTMLMMIEGL